MSLFKRFSATVYSQLDQAIGQIENHDAVVDASVREARHASAKAKVRLARVRAGGQRLRAQLQAVLESEQTWIDRARRAELVANICADVDEYINFRERARDYSHLFTFECTLQHHLIREEGARYPVESKGRRDASGALEQVRAGPIAKFIF